MQRPTLFLAIAAVIVGCLCISQVTALRGHKEFYYTTVWERYHRHCHLFGWGRCTAWRTRSVLQERCQKYWRDDGTGNCRIPVCTTSCYNGGTCVNPNTCKCTAAFTGSNCANLTNMHDASILSCQLTLANIRRADGKQLFYYSGPCSNKTKDVHWSNQELFNYAVFTMESEFSEPYNLPPRPTYVTNSGFGIVEQGYHVRHTKIKRNGAGGNFVALDKDYTCPGGASYTRPIKRVALCNVSEPNYKINIEDGDVFSVTYKTKSGGFSEIKNLDTNLLYRTLNYNGNIVDHTVEFRFDFIAPVHCSETNIRCLGNGEPIEIQEDITNTSISPKWGGWSDDRSGLDYYKLEVFKLEPNINKELVEMKPLSPVYSVILNDTTNLAFPTYTPPAPGMYSILLQASDKANNSRIARRLVLYDNKSTITLSTPAFNPNETQSVEKFIGDGGMHVTSAIQETGFMWQTGQKGKKIRITLDWTEHFVNKIHDDGKLLNKVLLYPTQFQELADSGILRSEKVVDPKLDDNTGLRTMDPIPNLHGIVKFEYCKVIDAERELPKTGWTTLPLQETLTFEESIDDGQFLRLWIRATDVMNHSVADYTEVHIDNTPPVVSSVELKPNLVNDSYLYTSRLIFSASDGGSGVHRIDYKLKVYGRDKPLKSGRALASRNNETDACTTYPECKCVLNECFLLNQSVAIDNCWFLVPSGELNNNGTVELTVYNQALLKKTFTINVGMLRHLQGLEEYSGPTNIRVVKKLPNGVRLAWDLPKTASCYGRMDITLVLVLGDGTTRVHHIYNEETSYDLLGLEPDKAYSIKMDLGYDGTAFSALSYDFQTSSQENYLSGGIIAGIVVSVLVVLAIMIAIFVVMLRRGHMQPVRRGIRAMTVRYRQSRVMRGRDNLEYLGTRANVDSIYQYGELDISQFKSWHIQRSSVVFDTLLTTGSFALIYKARIKDKRCTEDVAVAKTLKEGFKEADEILMKAKINFVISENIEHENVLKFLGAVIDDSDIGQFMLYEFCENGQLNKYLENQRNKVTIDLQENLYRFGLGVARGMDYLASKQIVHRRLAARNILLDRGLQVKITGFGPLPTEMDGDATGKRERIPIKWVAPECIKSSVDATERSDMWSFGVVLWEIFSLGQAPYGNLKGSELPAKLKSGTRLSKPENADDKWHSVMQRAWNYQPSKRPTFSEIRQELDQLFVAAPQDDYYYYRR